jgi:hypothetical protein
MQGPLILFFSATETINLIAERRCKTFPQFSLLFFIAIKNTSIKEGGIQKTAEGNRTITQVVVLIDDAIPMRIPEPAEGTVWRSSRSPHASTVLRISSCRQASEWTVGEVFCCSLRYLGNYIGDLRLFCGLVFSWDVLRAALINRSLVVFMFTSRSNVNSGRFKKSFTTLRAYII